MRILFFIWVKLAISHGRSNERIPQSNRDQRDTYREKRNEICLAEILGDCLNAPVVMKRRRGPVRAGYWYFCNAFVRATAYMENRISSWREMANIKCEAK